MNKWFSILTVVLLLGVSCTRESIKTLFATQETRIETLVSSQLSSNETYTVTTNEGSTRLIVEAGEGEELTDDKLVSFYYAGYILTGSSLPNASSLFATNSEEVATAARWDLSKADGDESEDAEASEDADGEDEEEEEPDPRYQIYTVKLSEAGFIDGLYNGIKGVKGGEECWIFFSGEHGFGSKQLGVIPANSAIAYHIWVHSVQSDEL